MSKSLFVRISTFPFFPFFDVEVKYFIANVRKNSDLIPPFARNNPFRQSSATLPISYYREWPPAHGQGLLICLFSKNFNITFSFQILMWKVAKRFYIISANRTESKSTFPTPVSETVTVWRLTTTFKGRKQFIGVKIKAHECVKSKKGWNNKPVVITNSMWDDWRVVVTPWSTMRSDPYHGWNQRSRCDWHLTRQDVQATD